MSLEGYPGRSCMACVARSCSRRSIASMVFVKLKAARLAGPYTSTTKAQRTRNRLTVAFISRPNSRCSSILSKIEFSAPDPAPPAERSCCLRDRTRQSLAALTAALSLVYHMHPATILEMPNEIYAAFDTTEGKFKIKLFADKAPNTVNNFVSLADGSKTGKPFYDGTVFHRVIPDFMIQGGDPEGTGRGGPGYKFADEFHPTLKHTKRGRPVAGQQAQHLRRSDRGLRRGGEDLQGSPWRPGPSHQGSQDQFGDDREDVVDRKS